MSDSVRHHRRKPTRLPCPWDSPGKNTGVGCHLLLQCTKVKSESEVAQSCPTLHDPMDCSLPGCSIHGIFQARALEWGCYLVLCNRIPYCSWGSQGKNTEVVSQSLLQWTMFCQKPSCSCSGWILLFFRPVTLEKAMTPHSSILAWKIPWTEEPGRLQSTGLLRVGHD